jgi:predicted metalloprotease with PDZ domain
MSVNILQPKDCLHSTKQHTPFPFDPCIIYPVIRRLHEKFSCGRTKCESVVVNVLTPFATQQIFEELESYVSHEFVHIANISKTRMAEWNTKSLTTFERWCEVCAK